MGIDFPMIAIVTCVDAGHDALAAKAARDIGNNFGPRDGRGIDRHLVCASQKERPGVFMRAYAATDRKRHEADFRCAGDDIKDGIAAFMAGGDIEKGDFVCTLFVVSPCNFNRVACITDIHKLYALYHPTFVDI